jgi:hypothetical protein
MKELLKLISWEGKKINKNNKSGINILLKDGIQKEMFPFKYYSGNGIRDKNMKVLKIDYNLPENSFWLYLILDEVVEVEQGRFLGFFFIF